MHHSQLQLVILNQEMQPDRSLKEQLQQHNVRLTWATALNKLEQTDKKTAKWIQVDSVDLVVTCGSTSSSTPSSPLSSSAAATVKTFRSGSILRENRPFAERSSQNKSTQNTEMSIFGADKYARRIRKISVCRLRFFNLHNNFCFNF